ncbi:hypothetical protein C1H46_035147 [Malus baccata]|uniref:Uncharacterized protein n=1 Tax=Malus baccata TaxID=106549 RepID=A0A540KYN2_MALBA|nr:hypothetical protein C1H46_035147 [Malus baccata]
MYPAMHSPTITSPAFSTAGLIAISLLISILPQLQKSNRSEVAELGVGEVDSQWFDRRCLVETCEDQRWLLSDLWGGTH